MAINQPPITGNNVMDAWMLEVTREINSGTSRSVLTEDRIRSISVITNNSAVENWALKANADEDIPDGKIADDIARDTEVRVKSVDTTGALSLSTTGELSVSQAALNNSLQARNLHVTIVSNMIGIVLITFDRIDPDTGLAFIAEIFDTHFLFLGGLKMIETVDYQTHLTDNTLTPNQVRLTQAITATTVGLRLELSNWSA